MQLPAPTIPERAGFYSVLPNAHWRRDLPRHTARVHAQSMSFGSHTTICIQARHLAKFSAEIGSVQAIGPPGQHYKEHLLKTRDDRRRDAEEDTAVDLPLDQFYENVDKLSAEGLREWYLSNVKRIWPAPKRTSTGTGQSANETAAAAANADARDEEVQSGAPPSKKRGRSKKSQTGGTEDSDDEMAATERAAPRPRTRLSDGQCREAREEADAQMFEG